VNARTSDALGIEIRIKFAKQFPRNEPQLCCIETSTSVRDSPMNSECFGKHSGPYVSKRYVEAPNVRETGVIFRGRR